MTCTGASDESHWATMKRDRVAMARILELLNTLPSPPSVDYVENRKQFHLQSLVTEQRHPKTWNLSSTVRRDPAAGLRQLVSVDQDIAATLGQLARTASVLEMAAQSVVEAIRSGHNVFVYGCGATGRLAKQVESTFWRPFWVRMKNFPWWAKISPPLPGDIEDRLTGEMTGGDRALVSSLEAFEDLPLIGSLQLQDRGIRRGDVVFCVTEGGETSSVIGSMLAALQQWHPESEKERYEASRHLYFVYNNPDDVLRSFQRSAALLDSPAITRINLTTGPQAIAGSTRLQATTIETFVLGAVLEEAVSQLLGDHLSSAEMLQAGFTPGTTLAARLSDFDLVQRAVAAAVPELARLTALETGTYRRRRFATYYAQSAVITVFTDNTERSPTFHLPPLDRADEEHRSSWTQVWTEAPDFRQAWHKLLGRQFRGLDAAFYRPRLEREVDDLYLRDGALRGLANAGTDQEPLYDFSLSPANVRRRAPEAGDLAVIVCVQREVLSLRDKHSGARVFADLVRRRQARLAIIAAFDRDLAPSAEEALAGAGNALIVKVVLERTYDPLTLRHQVVLKMLLNAHSTATMAALGRVIGNTMTNVHPGNLKLIGRATSLIMAHVNDTLQQPGWMARHGPTGPVTFEEANAVLFEAIDYVKREAPAQTAEVALSIIRMIEALDRRSFVTWAEAADLLRQQGLERYLMKKNPALRR
jgi:N-acetylmuramic acid 6-phosphate etherase